MRAIYALTQDFDDPVSGLGSGELPAPQDKEHWTTVDIAAASLNHHDLWSLKGVGLRAEQLPMILGTDGAGTTPDGTRVVLHAVIGADGHGVGPQERRSLLSEKYSGTMAEQVSVPTANLIPLPDSMSFETASCLPTAWLTAYSLLFRGAQLTPGNSVLIQGAGGGVATAATILGVAAGLEVFVTSRSQEKLDRAAALGATPIAHLERLPKRVDAAIETVGKATWSHSVASVRPGGIVAVAGATTGDADSAELNRIFFQEIRIQGVTMGARDDLAALVNLVATKDIAIPIDAVYHFDQAPVAFARLAGGDHFGKIVLSWQAK